MDPRESLRDLGHRLAQRRHEAGLDAATLADRAAVRADLVEAFERGEGGLGTAQLARIAGALGIPLVSFVHTDARTEKAALEPDVLLAQKGPGYLADEDRRALAEGLRRARGFASLRAVLGGSSLSDHFAPEPAPAKRPHEAGYRRALEARALLPERTAGIQSLARLLEDRFDILVIDLCFEHEDVFGAACRSGKARLVAVRPGLSESARRFVLAHELAHHLMDLDEQGVRADEGDATKGKFWMSPHPGEQRAGAFAAMFLAPGDAVAQVLGPARGPSVGLDDARSLTERAMAAFGMGFAACAWHLHNLGYFDRGAVDALLLTAGAERVSGFEQDTRYGGLERRVFEALAREAISPARARELLGRELPIDEAGAQP